MGNLFDKFIRMGYKKRRIGIRKRSRACSNISYIPSDAARTLTGNHFPPWFENGEHGMVDLIPVLTEDQIRDKVALLAKNISSDYQSDNLVLICVLKGAVVFLSDLMRHLTIPVEIDFIELSSYGNNDVSSGTPLIRKDVHMDLRDKHVLVVEDIVDTGWTLAALVDYLKSKGPKSVRTCVMIDKLERRKTDIRADYVCHTVNGGFLVGYGLDYAEKYRNLPDICHLKK